MKQSYPVEVLWEDSDTPGKVWIGEDEFDEWAKSGTLQVRSVGLLVRKTKRDVVIIQSRHDQQVLNALRIPRGCVLSIKKLSTK